MDELISTIDTIYVKSKRVYLTLEQIRLKREARKCLGVNPKLTTPENRPEKYSLQDKCPFIYNQGAIGSCTANAICMAILMLEQDKTFLPSRRYLYYKERLSEITPGEQISDSGADAADGLNILVKNGICPESVCPYDESKCNEAPPEVCDQEAAKHKIHQIGTIADNAQGKALTDAIANTIYQGIPVLIGIQVYSSFESEAVAKTGKVPMPKWYERYIGGHEVLIVGYDDVAQEVTCVNSWGSDWGNKGFFTLPYSFVQDNYLTSEFICITQV